MDSLFSSLCNGVLENFEFRNMLDFHVVGGADVAFKLSAQSSRAQTYKTPSPNLKQRDMQKMGR